MKPSILFYIGLDLGQSNDYSALVVVERYGEYVRERALWEPHWVFREYQVRHAYRFPLGTSYPDVARYVTALQGRVEIKGRNQLIVDKTGVGNAVVDILREEGAQRMTTVSITGGNDVNRVGPEDYTVPKRELASVLHKLFSTSKLRTNPDLPYLEELRQEIAAFAMKINAKSGHDTYEALTSADHDDLVMALGMACWYAERPQPVHRALLVGF